MSCVDTSTVVLFNHPPGIAPTTDPIIDVSNELIHKGARHWDDVRPRHSGWKFMRLWLP
jgi:hypothetical protein